VVEELLLEVEQLEGAARRKPGREVEAEDGRRVTHEFQVLAEERPQSEAVPFPAQ